MDIQPDHVATEAGVFLWAMNSIGTVLGRFVGDLPSGAQGIGTGLVELERAAGYIGGGDLVIAAGRSGIGSTSFVLSIAQHVAVEERLPTVVATLDFIRSELAIRVLACHSRLPLQALRTGQLSSSQRSVLSHAQARLRRAPITIDSVLRDCSAEELASRIGHEAHIRGARLVVVDAAPNFSVFRDEASRAEELGLLVRLLKGLARREGATVLTTWRVREFDQKPGRHRLPLRMDDLIGEATDDADVVILIEQDPLFDGPADIAELHVNIAKNRHAMPGRCELGLLTASGAVVSLAA